MEELPLGGTAVGTGLNCHPDFPRLAIAHLSKRTRVPFREAADHFEAQSAKDGIVEASGQLKTVAVEPVQDRQRHPLAEQRPALRLRRDRAAGHAAGQFDHAGQGQPGDVRGADAGLRAGVRRRRDDHLGGGGGQLALNST